MWGIAIYIHKDKKWIWDIFPRYVSKEEAERIKQMLYPKSKENPDSNSFFKIAQEINNV